MAEQRSKDLLSGFVVGLSVIPETAGFAIMVGLDVGVAFYTTFYMAFVLSLFGARKAMISLYRFSGAHFSGRG